MASSWKSDLSLLQGDFPLTNTMDENEPETVAAEGTSSDVPFSWQLPPPPPPTSWLLRAEIESELRANTQRHFERTERTERTVRFSDEVRDAPSDGRMRPFYSDVERPKPRRAARHRGSQGKSKTPANVSPPVIPPVSAPASPPSESSFLEWYPTGRGNLSFQNDSKMLESIQEVNINLIEQRCPILAMAFEDSRSGPQLYLETLTSRTALPFLRFLYSGSYALGGASGDFYEDVPSSVLFHCQLYRLGDIYDLPELKSQAYVNVLRQCEFGCSSPEKLIDLCAAIRYVYECMSEHENLKDAIVNYCVACFLQHRLAEDEEFRTIAYDLRPFHQDLCKNSMSRQFENETASAIIQMPFKPFIPETYASREDVIDKRFEDVVYHFHANDENDASPKKRKRPEVASKEDILMTLPFRPIPQTDASLEQETKLEDTHYDFGSKRRVSSADPYSSLVSSTDSLIELPLRPRPKAPASLSTASAVDKEYCVVNGDNASPTSPAESTQDAGFEIVAGPSAVLEASDSESDSDTLVEVSHADAESAPSERGASPALAANADGEWDDCDTEWTLV